MIFHRVEEGFSAAELLIAIFVGAAFILTGYQLYGIIAGTGGDARNQAMASNAGYSILREYAGQVSDTCDDDTPLTLVPTPSGLTLPGTTTIFVTMACPAGMDVSPISLVTVYIYYDIVGTNYKLVEHAMYASQG